MKDILQMHNVKHNYNGRTVLEVPELSIRQGSITGLAGPNGSGKSTMLKLLSLSEKCHLGTIFFHGKPAVPFTDNNGLRLTLLPQEPYLLKRSVFDNVTYGLKIREKNNHLSTAVREALDLVGLPSSFSTRQWHELSGGEAQRVALAARLALKPDCLLLDEPTASVDMESARSISKAVLTAQQQWGTTLIIASHHRSWLNDICDRLIYLYNGRILDCSFENVLLGPWEKTDNNEFVKRLTDGQRIHVSKPPRPDSSAVIAPEAITLSTSKPDVSKTLLQGTVTGIFSDKHFATPRIHVTCGDHRFIVSCSIDAVFSMENFRPGNTVTLTYNPSDITWLPE